MEEYKGVSREKIPWHPRIDYEKCVGCRQCFEFCKNNVYEWDEENNYPVVENPNNCVINCIACAKFCPQEAISFPSREEIEELVKKSVWEQGKH